MATGAVLNTTTSEITITYDRMLDPAVVATTGSWFCRALIQLFDLGGLTVSGRQLTGSVTSITPSFGPNVLDYLATPPEVVDWFGYPAAAQSDIPLTIV